MATYRREGIHARPYRADSCDCSGAWACGSESSDPTTSDEYQALAQQLTDTQQQLADVTAEREALLATTRPAATPATYGPVTVVEGISTFVSGFIGAQTSDPDGARHYRGGTFVFDEVMNDPRVSGQHTVTNFSMDYWGPDNDNVALVQWGDELIENDGGTWEGWASGIYSTERGDLIAVWFEGTGEYAGLSYFYMSDSLDVADGMTNHWRVRGQIFPGMPPER